MADDTECDKFSSGTSVKSPNPLGQCNFIWQYLSTENSLTGPSSVYEAVHLKSILTRCFHYFQKSGSPSQNILVVKNF